MAVSLPKATLSSSFKSSSEGDGVGLVKLPDLGGLIHRTILSSADFYFLQLLVHRKLRLIYLFSLSIISSTNSFEYSPGSGMFVALVVSDLIGILNFGGVFTQVICH